MLVEFLSFSCTLSSPLLLSKFPYVDSLSKSLLKKKGSLLDFDLRPFPLSWHVLLLALEIYAYCPIDEIFILYYYECRKVIALLFYGDPTYCLSAFWARWLTHSSSHHLLPHLYRKCSWFELKLHLH